MIFVPVTIVVLINPSIFITALTLAGGFGAVLLLGFLPIVLVAIGRGDKRFASMPRYLFGGNFMLLVLLIALIAEVLTTIYVML